MIKIDVDAALKGIDQAIEEVGGEDHVYESQNPYDGCTYVHFEETYDDENGRTRMNERPGCLVGRVLINAGVPYEEFFAKNGAPSINSGYDASQALYRLVGRGVLEVTDDAVAVLMTAQVVQDDEKTWGAAREAAKAKAEYLASIN